MTILVLPAKETLILGKKQNPAYEEYLRSKAWKEKRQQVFGARGRTCEECGSRARRGKFLEVHHLTYERLGNELLSDLRILCWACHRNEHRKPTDARILPVVKPRPKQGNCRKCGKKFNPKSYPQGNGWYCGDKCWAVSKKQKALTDYDAEVRSRIMQMEARLGSQ